MKNRAIRAKSALRETAKAIRTVTAANIRADLAKQLREAEQALKKQDSDKVTAFMQGLVTTVLILRRSLTARIASDVLSGILVDCQKLNIALPLTNDKDRARCVFNRGICVAARQTKCVTIDTAWGCGTVPRLQVIE